MYISKITDAINKRGSDLSIGAFRVEDKLLAEQDRKGIAVREEEDKVLKQASGAGAGAGSGSSTPQKEVISKGEALFARWQEYNLIEESREDLESNKTYLVTLDEGQKLEEINNAFDVLKEFLLERCSNLDVEYVGCINNSFGEDSALRGYFITMRSEPKMLNLMLSLINFVASVSTYESLKEVVQKLQIFPLSLTDQDFACIPGVQNRLEMAACRSVDEEDQKIIDAFDRVLQRYYLNCYKFVCEGNNVHIKEAIKYVLGFKVEDDFAKVTSKEIPADILYGFFVNFDRDFELEHSKINLELLEDKKTLLRVFLEAHPVSNFNEESGEYDYVLYEDPALIHRLEDKLKAIGLLDIEQSLSPYHYPLWIEESKSGDGSSNWKSIDHIIDEVSRRNRGIYPKLSDEEEVDFDVSYLRDTASSITLAPSVSPRSEVFALDGDSRLTPSSFELSRIDFPDSIFHKDFPSIFAQAILRGDLEIKKKAIKILSLIGNISFIGSSNKIIAETFLIIASGAHIEISIVGSYLLSVITRDHDRSTIDEAALALGNAQKACDFYISYVAVSKEISHLEDDLVNSVICDLANNARFEDVKENINHENVVEVLNGLSEESNFQLFMKQGVNNPKLNELICHIINVYPKERLVDLKYPLSQIVFAKFRVGDLSFFEAMKDEIEKQDFVREILYKAFSYDEDSSVLSNLLYLSPESARDIFAIRDDEVDKVLLNEEYVGYLARNFVDDNRPSAFANLVKYLFDDKLFSDILIELLSKNNNAAARLLMNSYQEALVLKPGEEGDEDKFGYLIYSLCEIMIGGSSDLDISINSYSIFIIAANQENEDFLYKIYEIIGANNTAEVLKQIIQSINFSSYSTQGLDKKRIFETALNLARKVNEVEEGDFIEKLPITNYAESILKLAIDEDGFELFEFMWDFDNANLEYKNFVKIIESEKAKNLTKLLLLSPDIMVEVEDAVEIDGDEAYLGHRKSSLVRALFRYCIEDKNDCSSIKRVVKSLKELYQENFDQKDLVEGLDDGKKAIVIKHAINHKLSEFIKEEDGYNVLEEARASGRKDLLIEVLKIKAEIYKNNQEFLTLDLELKSLIKNLIGDEFFISDIDLESSPHASPSPVDAVVITAEKYDTLFGKCSELLLMLEGCEDELPSSTTELLGDILRLEGEVVGLSV